MTAGRSVPGFEVRRAHPADTGSLLPLIEAYWQFEGLADFDRDGVADALHRLISDPRLGAGWLASVHDEVSGYLLAVYVFSLEHGGLTAEIDEFYVADAHRGLGMGGVLLRTAEEEFAQKGCSNVSLQVARNNGRARRFYERLGSSRRSGFELFDKTLPAQAPTFDSQ